MGPCRVWAGRMTCCLQGKHLEKTPICSKKGGTKHHRRGDLRTQSQRRGGADVHRFRERTGKENYDHASGERTRQTGLPKKWPHSCTNRERKKKISNPRKPKWLKKKGRWRKSREPPLRGQRGRRSSFSVEMQGHLHKAPEARFAIVDQKANGQGGRRNKPGDEKGENAINLPH